MRINKCIYNLFNLVRKLGFNFHEEKNEKVLKMKEEINKLGKIEFKIEQFPDGSWTAESINLDGVITGSKDVRDISIFIKDALFTYFEIPAYLCVDTLLKGDNEPVTVMQSIYA